MYETGDTICAVSSAAPTPGAICESIIRISGPAAFAAAAEVFSTDRPMRCPGLTTGSITFDGLVLDAVLYAFAAPRSYTGEDLAELHVIAAAPVVEAIMARLHNRARPAGPGEFTLRAYLNGRMDLSQAEAVAQVVSGSNTVQLAAAARLLSGRLAQTIADQRRRILDLLSLLEAGMDFSGEDITFVTADQAIASARRSRAALNDLLEGSIRFEATIDLPACMVEQQIDRMMQEFQYQLGFQGIKMEDYVKMTGMDFSQMREQSKEEAEKRVRTSLVLEKIQKGEANYHAIEIMACSGGCLNGGGQPYHHGDSSILEKRMEALYRDDGAKTIRKSHQNPSIRQLYSEFLGEPGSHCAHKLLHTTYVNRKK